jgi:hypothetical protein
MLRYIDHDHFEIAEALRENAPIAHIERAPL